MDEKYSKYIADLKMTYSKAYGNCKPICKQMKEHFPELKRIRGHYYCIVWGERMHWWLQPENGDIIDPTAIQFPTKGHGVYEPWDETQDEPIGKCPNCGEYIFNGCYVHSIIVKRRDWIALKINFNPSYSADIKRSYNKLYLSIQKGIKHGKTAKKAYRRTPRK